MKRIQGLSEVIKKYDAYVIDMCGVIHDGSKPYPEAVSAIQELQNQNKEVFILSNAPRPYYVPEAKFKDFGLAIEGKNIVTSGDFFRHHIQNNSTDIFDNMQGKAMLVGSKQNNQLLEDMNITTTDSLDEADYLILLMFTEANELQTEYDDLFKAAIAKGIPALCPNPDKVVPHGESIRYPAGTFAKAYEDMGGEVYFFGKPYKPIYDFILDKIKASKKKILAIGDSLETDILGAKNAGIDSLLITGGMYRNESNVEKLFEKYNVTPTLILNYLQY